MPIDLAGLYVFSYLAGAVPTAYLIAKLARGVDIRGYGSGNVGGSNLFYLVGKRWLAPLAVFDIIVKGAVPVWIAQYAFGLDRSPVLLAVAPLLAVAGHNWSPYLGFQGGRGVAVASGSLLALSPLLLIAFVVVAAGGWIVTRASGVWILISLILLPLWAMLLPMWGFIGSERHVISWYCIALLALVVVKRLLSNWTPLYDGLPKEKVLFNRLFRDRDVDSNEEWVRRKSQETE